MSAGEGSLLDWLSVAALAATAIGAVAGALRAGIATRMLAALVAATGITLAQWEKTLGTAAMHDAELAAWVLLASGLGSLVLARRGIGETAS